MARVELPKGIAAIHGRVGDYIYRMRGDKAFVHYQPRKTKETLSKHLSST